MKVVNIFDAVRDGTYDQFMDYYSGNVNLTSDNLGMNLLCLAMVNDKNPTEKLKIVKFLISKGIDINFTDKKDGRNALHIFYFNTLKPSIEYMKEVTTLLVDAGINVNAKDKYDAIPLKYSITITKLPTDDMREVYKYLLMSGSDYSHKDSFGKSCIDYAKEYSWRNNVIDIIKEYENENG